MSSNFIMTKKKAVFLFEVVSASLLIGIAAFYGLRGYRLYKEDKQKRENAVNYEDFHFFETLELSVDPYKQSDGLILVPGTGNGSIGDNNGDSYYWQGAAEKNWVSYGGILFRMLDIDSYGQIRMVSEDCVLQSVMEYTGFKQSGLYEALNVTQNEYSGLLEKNLLDADVLLMPQTQKAQILDDQGQVVSQAPDELIGSVGLLTLADYLKAGGSSSFLNNGQSTWLADATNDWHHFYIDSDGTLGVTTLAHMIKGVRVVVSLSYGCYITGGSGTQTNPFVIKTPTLVSGKAQNASDLVVGQTVSYSGLVWTVSEKTSGGDVVLLLKDVLKNEDGSVLRMTYQDASSYLEGDFIQNLRNPELLRFHSWNVGPFNDILPDEGFLYPYAFSATRESKISFASSSLLFMDEACDIFYANGVYSSDDLVTYADEEGVLRSTNKNRDIHAVKPAICISGEAIIESGLGSHKDPFVIGGDIHEEK